MKEWRKQYFVSMRTFLFTLGCNPLDGLKSIFRLSSLLRIFFFFISTAFDQSESATQHDRPSDRRDATTLRGRMDGFFVELVSKSKPGFNGKRESRRVSRKDGPGGVKLTRGDNRKKESISKVAAIEDTGEKPNENYNRAWYCSVMLAIKRTK